MPQEYAYENSFKVELLSERYKSLNNSIVDTSIPGLSIGTSDYPTAKKTLIVPGTNTTIEELRLTFMLDEDYTNWRLVYSWLNNLSSFSELNDDFTDITDIGIHILNNKLNHEFVIQLEDCFPISLSEIPLNSQINSTTAIKFDVTFVVNGINIED